MAIRVALLGGTGAMGAYLAPELIKRGYKVDITTRGGGYRSGVNLRYITGDARDVNFMKQIIDTNYDVIIDFMVYPTPEFKDRIDTLLSSTTQYIFLSTYRVFADTEIIIESSPRLLDVSNDKEYLATDEYALQKAREEDILRGHEKKNWTIVRPSITYSKERFQLGVFESPYFVARALEGKATVFPAEMLDKYTTMTWAGDVAKMISGLVLNPKAFGEDFNVVTSEHRKWSEVISYYQNEISLKVKIVSLDSFLKVYPGKYQVLYDRMYDRMMDNTKILKVTGLKQSGLTALESGLSRELERFIEKPRFGEFNEDLNIKIDSLTEGIVQKTRKKIRPRLRLRELKQKARIRTRARDFKRKTRVRTRIRQIAKARQVARKAGAIVTLTSVFNYGNVIQMYALKTYLKKHGYDFDNIEMPSWVDGMSDSIFGDMREFVAKYIGGVKFGSDSTKYYKRYIVGSDQVWRNWYEDDLSRFTPFFLDFIIDKEVSRISYAASFGVDDFIGADINNTAIEKIKPLLDKFDSISVREDSGVQLVRSIIGNPKHNVKVAIDPTLLLGGQDYSALIDMSKSADLKTAKVFSYILDQTNEKHNFIKRVAKSFDDDYCIINPSVKKRYEPVETWLKGFRDADFIITDSFHGAVFAIINRKEFVVFSNKERGNARFDTLLSSLGISNDRLISDSDNNLSTTPIDWISVEKRLESLRKESGEWLLDAVMKGSREKK